MKNQQEKEVTKRQDKKKDSSRGGAEAHRAIRLEKKGE